jgi:hypothetical protein
MNQIISWKAQRIYQSIKGQLYKWPEGKEGGKKRRASAGAGQVLFPSVRAPFSPPERVRQRKPGPGGVAPPSFTLDPINNQTLEIDVCEEETFYVVVCTCATRGTSRHSG